MFIINITFKWSNYCRICLRVWSSRGIYDTKLPIVINIVKPNYAGITLKSYSRGIVSPLNISQNYLLGCGLGHPVDRMQPGMIGRLEWQTYLSSHRTKLESDHVDVDPYSRKRPRISPKLT